jgi:cobalt-zinc-cadmium efflux system membrane fusion protein
MSKLYFILSTLILVSCGQNAKNQEIAAESHNEHGEETVLTAAQMKTVDIQLDTVEMRNLNSVIRVNGELALDPQRKAEVTSLVGGIVAQMLATEGKFVQAGQTVAYIENAEIVELQKNYLVLKKETMIAEQEYNRQRELSAQGAGIDKNLQQSAANYEITKAQLAALEKQLQQLAISPEHVSAGNLATRIPLKAPIAGYINRIYVNTGNFVDMQSPLMSIVDNSQMHCDLKVFEKDIRFVRVGQQADIILTNQPDIRLQAVIYDINKSLEDDTRAIVVHTKIADKRGAELFPGMSVTALINTSNVKTQAVPNEAIVSREGKKFIYMLENAVSTSLNNHKEEGEDETFHFVAVEIITGISELGYTQITPIEPLPAAALIVKSNAFYLASMGEDHGEHGH